MVRYLMMALLCLLTSYIYGQNDWQNALRQWMMVEDMDDSYSEEAMEQLAEVAAQPINLNQTTREELEALPFLSAIQVEEIVEYI